MKTIILTFLNLFLICELSSGQTMDWVSLPQEVNGFVNCLTVFDGKLIAGGHFSMAGASSANKIAAWDGTNWNSLGIGMNGETNPFVTSALSTDSTLYVVGNFETAGTADAIDIAKWDGSNWSALGTGSNDVIHCIVSYNDEIYVGGTFDSIGGVAANHIAKWDGLNWQPLSTGIQGNNVNELYVYEDELYVLGVFESAGDIPCNYIARWNGSSWNNVSEGLNYGNSAMIEWDSNLLVGSELHLILGEPVLRSHVWDGSIWAGFSEQLMFHIRTFAIFDENLYCSGGLGAASEGSSMVAIWEDSEWVTVGTGVNYYIQGLCQYNGDLYCGGYFNTMQDGFHNYIARLDNSVGIDQIDNDNISINIFPNPSKKKFTIQIDSSRLANGAIFTAYDLTGRIVFTEILTKTTTVIDDFNNKGIIIWKIENNEAILKTGKILIE